MQTLYRRQLSVHVKLELWEQHLKSHGELKEGFEGSEC